jgi:hypothetical protein
MAAKRRNIGRIESHPAAEGREWKDVMHEVWEAQKRVKPAERVPSPVLLERKRRRH